MQVAAMDDGVGIAETRAKLVAEVDVADLAIGQRVHQPELVDIDRHAARRSANPKMVEAMKGIGPELNTRADLAEAVGLLEDLRGDALLGQGQRRRQSADAAPGDENPIWGHR